MPTPNNVGIQVPVSINRDESKRIIEQQLEELSKLLEPIVVNLKIDNTAIDVLKKIADNIKDINKLAGNTNKEFRDTIKTIEDLGNGTKRITTQYFQPDGNIIEKTSEQLKNVQQGAIQAEDAINKFKESIAENFDGNISAVTGKFVDGKLAGLEATLRSGVDSQRIFGNQFGQITANNDTEQIQKRQQSLQLAEEMFRQYIDVMDGLSQRGIISQEDLLKAETILSEQYSKIAEGMTKSIAPVKAAFDDLLSTERSAMAQIEKSDAMIQELLDKTALLRQNPNANVNNIDTLESMATGLQGTGNVDAVRNLDGMYQKLTQDVRDLEDLEKQRAAFEKQDVVNFQDGINEKIKIVRVLQQTQRISSTQAYNELKQLYTQNLNDVRMNTDTELKLIKAMYDQEVQIAKDAADKQQQTQQNSFKRFNHTGFGLGPLDMGVMMLEFGAQIAIFDNLKKGLVDVQQGSAGIQQVFQNQITSQQQLTDVTNQFIGIAEKYGTSITDVTNAAKLWGRQYKDVNEALILTNNSTLLSIVDNLRVVDANRAVESSMNAMQMSVKNTSDAYASSMKLVDSWSAVSHEASVSAQDLTQGFERSAAAAHVAGLSIDSLNAMVAAGVRNTGKRFAPYE